MRARVLWIGIAALAGAGCTAGGVRPGPPAPAVAWEPVSVGVTLVAEDPTENAILVRGQGPVTVFGPPHVSGNAPTRPSTPPLDEVPPHARTVITAARGLRWFDIDGFRRPAARGIPDGRLGGRWGPALAEWSLVDGVLVEVPLLGPEQGLPRPRCVLETDAGWPDSTLATGREDHVLFVAEGRAAAVVVASCEVLPLTLAEHAPMVVRPGLSPDGRVGAIAARRLGADPGGRLAPYAVVVIDHGRIAQVVPVSKPPLALHVAGGAVFAEVEESRGRTLLRHAFARPTAAFLTDRDRAALRHGAGLRARLLEDVEEGQLTSAADTLAVLRDDGLADLPTVDDLALEAELVQAIRPLLVKAADAARREGSLELAALADRRAHLLDGRPALEAPPPLPTLRLALSWADETGLTEGSFDELVAPEHVRRVNACGPPESRGLGTACLALRFELAGPASPRALRAAAERYATRRLACVDDGAAVLLDDAAGLRSAWSCDGEAQATEALAAFRTELASARDTKRPLVTATYEDGGTERLVIPAANGLTPAEAALELVLARQGERYLARRERGATEVEARYLRTLLWRRAPLADRAIAAAVGADGKLRRRGLSAR
jgi:hypothetical protein